MFLAKDLCAEEYLCRESFLDDDVVRQEFPDIVFFL